MKRNKAFYKRLLMKRLQRIEDYHRSGVIGSKVADLMRAAEERNPSLEKLRVACRGAWMILAVIRLEQRYPDLRL